MKEVNYVLPLFRRAESIMGTEPAEELESNLQRDALAKLLSAVDTKADPRQVFGYVYAVLHSPEYRSRYAAMLVRHFARIPIPRTAGLFNDLADLGTQLVALHLLSFDESKSESKVRFVGPNNSAPVVKRPRYDPSGRLFVDAESYFERVPEEVWRFRVGNYQVCEKWLKDRKGHKLSKDDISHYAKVLVALAETIRVMAEIDAAIESHGGWPGAFAVTAVETAGQ